MRKSQWIAMALILAGAFVAALILAPFSRADAGGSARELGGFLIAQPQPNENEQEGEGQEQEIDYIRVTTNEIQQFPEEFENKYVQVADRFSERMDNVPRELRRYRITDRTHVAFTTHPVTGSNMLCVVSREAEGAVRTLGTLVNESPIFLMGRVGPVVDTPRGPKPIFLVDQMVRGHQPPAMAQERKPVIVVLEYLVQGADGQPTPRVAGEYKIPEFGKRYVVPDPYDRNRKLFITVKE